MRAMGGRPTLMQRFPDGAGGPTSSRSGCPRTRPTGWRRRPSRPSTARRPTRSSPRTSPTSCGPSTSGASASTCGRSTPATPTTSTSCASTSTPSPAPTSPTRPGRRSCCAALLDEVGIASYPKTTGNRGLHVYVRLEPRWDSYQVRAGAVAVARELERRRPDLLTAAWWKEERGERIFVDYNQNAPHKTVFGAWSVRSRVGRAGLDPAVVGRAGRRRPLALTLATVPERVARDGRPVGRGRRAAGPRPPARPVRTRTWPTASWTPRGRPSTPSSPTSRPGWRPAGPPSPPPSPSRRPRPKGAPARCRGRRTSRSSAGGGPSGPGRAASGWRCRSRRRSRTARRRRTGSRR